MTGGRLGESDQGFGEGRNGGGFDADKRPGPRGCRVSFAGGVAGDGGGKTAGTIVTGKQIGRAHV